MLRKKFQISGNSTSAHDSWLDAIGVMQTRRLTSKLLPEDASFVWGRCTFITEDDQCSVTSGSRKRLLEGILFKLNVLLFWAVCKWVITQVPFASKWITGITEGVIPGHNTERV